VINNPFKIVKGGFMQTLSKLGDEHKIARMVSDHSLEHVLGDHGVSSLSILTESEFHGLSLSGFARDMEVFVIHNENIIHAYSWVSISDMLKGEGIARTILKEHENIDTVVFLERLRGQTGNKSARLLVYIHLGDSSYHPKTGETLRKIFF